MRPYIVALVYVETFDLDLYFDCLWGKIFLEMFILEGTSLGNSPRVCENTEMRPFADIRYKNDCLKFGQVCSP